MTTTTTTTKTPTTAFAYVDSCSSNNQLCLKCGQDKMYIAVSVDSIALASLMTYTLADQIVELENIATLNDIKQSNCDSNFYFDSESNTLQFEIPLGDCGMASSMITENGEKYVSICNSKK